MRAATPHTAHAPQHIARMSGPRGANKILPYLKDLVYGAVCHSISLARQILYGHTVACKGEHLACALQLIVGGADGIHL